MQGATFLLSDFACVSQGTMGIKYRNKDYHVTPSRRISVVQNKVGQCKLHV